MRSSGSVSFGRDSDFFLSFGERKRKRKKNKEEQNQNAKSVRIFCPFSASVLVIFLYENPLRMQVNRLRYSEGLRSGGCCQINPEYRASTVLTLPWTPFRKTAPILKRHMYLSAMDNSQQ